VINAVVQHDSAVILSQGAFALTQHIMPTLSAIALLGILPLALWAEAHWRGSPAIRKLTSVLAILWFFAIITVSLPELLCEGSVLNALSNCKGPFKPEMLVRFVAVGPLLPIVLLIYAGTVVARIVSSRGNE
jgi:hypothetical protein